MANHATTSQAHQSIYTPVAHNQTKLFIIIDSNPPVTLCVPRAPGQLTLKEFKNFASLNSNSYKFYFQSHDSEFGKVKEELADDDSILPVEDGHAVVWVISNDGRKSAALFEPVVENHNIDELEGVYHSGGREPSLNYARDNSKRQLFSTSQPSSPARSFDFNFVNGEKSTPPKSFKTIYITLHLNAAQSLGLGHVYSGDESSNEGIIVNHVQHNSVAERDGRICSGDRIVEVNGVDLTCLCLSDAIRVFKQFVEQGGDINLVIQRLNIVQPMSTVHPPKTPDNRPQVPPRPPVRDLSAHMRPASSYSKTKVGFDPTTELPDPIIEPDQLPSSTKYKTTTTKPQPIVNFHRNSNDHEQQRASQSLPRSLTPRSWYTTGNLNNVDSSTNLGIYQMDSRSDYEPTTSESLRLNPYQVPLHCGKDSIQTIYAALKADSTSLDVRDREWLKVVVKDAFLGSTLIKWLSKNIYGFCNRSEVKRYANQLLILGLIKSPMSKATFSEKCFYILT